MGRTNKVAWKCDACGVEIVEPGRFRPHGWLVVYGDLATLHNRADLCSRSCLLAKIADNPGDGLSLIRAFVSSRKD